MFWKMLLAFFVLGILSGCVIQPGSEMIPGRSEIPHGRINFLLDEEYAASYSIVRKGLDGKTYTETGEWGEIELLIADPIVCFRLLPPGDSFLGDFKSNQSHRWVEVETEVGECLKIE